MSNETVSADYLKNIWKFFASLNLTIVVLLSLAVTSIIGTLIPQNENPVDYFRTFGEFTYRLFDVLDLFDMYHSWWFQLLVVLLTVNVLVCSIDRLQATWKIIFVRVPKFNLERYRNRKSRHDFSVDRAPDALRETYAAAVARRFSYSRVEETGGGFAVFGEKWRLSRLGVYIVHLSVILLLLGGLIGSIFGFEGFVNIPEGETVDSIRVRNSDRTIPLGFSIRCDDFDLSFYPSGPPKEYRSSLAILEAGKVVLKKDIIVNDPLRYKGINIFQSSYGELPPEQPPPRRSPLEKVVLSITSKESGMTYEKEAVMGETIGLPEGKGSFTLKEYRPAAKFRGQDIGEALVGMLTPASGPPAEVLLPLRFPSFDRMRRGALFISVIDQGPESAPAGPPQKRYFTGLQVTRDPGVLVVYAGFILMILGCFVTFFMSHQQICVEVSAEGDGSRVMVSGTAHRNKMAMAGRVERMAEGLALEK